MGSSAALRLLQLQGLSRFIADFSFRLLPFSSFSCPPSFVLLPFSSFLPSPFVLSSYLSATFSLFLSRFLLVISLSFLKLPLQYIISLVPSPPPPTTPSSIFSPCLLFFYLLLLFLLFLLLLASWRPDFNGIFACGDSPNIFIPVIKTSFSPRFLHTACGVSGMRFVFGCVFGCVCVRIYVLLRVTARNYVFCQDSGAYRM